MAINKIPGPGMTPAANMKAWFIQGFCNGEMTLCGKITIGAAGVVTAVTGPNVSAISNTTSGTGVYRVYIPPCRDMAVIAHYNTTNTFANQANISLISAVSGYFDVVVHSAAGVSTPASGDIISFIAHLATSKVAV